VATSCGLTNADMVNRSRLMSSRYVVKFGKFLFRSYSRAPNENSYILCIANKHSYILCILDLTKPFLSQSEDCFKSFHDKELIYKMWCDCTQHGVPFDLNFLSLEKNAFRDTFHRSNVALCQRKNVQSKDHKNSLPFNQNVFDSLPLCSQIDYAESFVHESAMFQLQHKQCSMCKSVSMWKDYSVVRNSIGQFRCSECKQKEDDFFFKLGSNRLLPVWYDVSGSVHYEQPDILSCLRFGEQLLIQRFSVFVPVVHIRNGNMGINGHCCCFKQEVSEVASVLPRKSSSIVVVLKGSIDRNGAVFKQTFSVRRKVVMNALLWLKRHHKWYREDPDLVIDEANLSWMNGVDEAELSDIHYVQETDESVPFSNGIVSGVNDISNLEEHIGKLSQVFFVWLMVQCMKCKIFNLVRLSVRYLDMRWRCQSNTTWCSVDGEW